MSCNVMKAIRVSEFGGSKVLEYCSGVAVPVLSPRQVLIKIKAAGVNPVDTYIRSGTYAFQPTLPYTPGNDGAGIVESIGADVKTFSCGDHVFTALGCSGTYSEYAVADESHVFPLDHSLSFQQGAALGIPYFTAYRALFVKAKVKPGETVFVHGASGAVGIAAVQLAVQHGCKVIGTAGTDEGMNLVKEVGAQHVFCHRTPGYEHSINELTSVDVILEMLANVNLETDLRIVNSHGRIVVIGTRGSVEITPRHLLAKEVSIIGVKLGFVTPEELETMSADLAISIKDKVIKPIIDKEMPLEQACKAHDDIIHSSGAKGKIVLIP